MHRLISKHKLYLYLFFFVSLTSIFNFQILENITDKFNLKTINIQGLSSEEIKSIQTELNNFKDENIFKLSQDKILQKLNKFKFLEDIYVNKIIPSSININLYKTSIIGKTQINKENFFIGKNGKLINYNQIFVTNKIPTVFGDFKIDEFLNLNNILVDSQINFETVKNFYYFKNKRWDLLFYDGLLLMLPSKEIEKSIKIYKKLLETENFKNVKVIDLRVSNQIILTKKHE